MESVYEECFIEELKQKNLQVTAQQKVPLIYRGKTLKTELRLDDLVSDLTIVELRRLKL